MSREIKFRAWHTKSKCWSDPFGLFQDLTFNRSPVFPRRDKFSIDDLIYCQFTGLKDKNGKEIYEGDIVSTNVSFLGTLKTNHQVHFSDGAFRVGVSCLEGDGVTGIEIIGNIYANPDLLTNSK